MRYAILCCLLPIIVSVTHVYYCLLTFLTFLVYVKKGEKDLCSDLSSLAACYFVTAISLIDYCCHLLISVADYI